MNFKYLLLAAIAIIFSNAAHCQYSEAIDLHHHAGGRNIPVDFDNDGDLDILSDNKYDMYLYLNNGNNSFDDKEIHVSSSFGPYSGVKTFVCEDINQDGYPDVISGESTSVNCFLNNGDNTMSETWSGYANDARSIAVGDIDNDGLKDLVVGYYWNTTINWHKNLGGGIFDTASPVTNLPGGRNEVFIGDINYDGNPDVYCCSNQFSELYWISGNGNGTFGAATMLVNAHSYLVSFVDMDSDGIKDLMSTTYGYSGSNDDVFWLKNDGSGNFTGKQYIHNPGVNNYNAYKGFPTDYDGDGDIDVLSTHSEAPELHINYGNGTFAPPVIMESYPSGRTILGNTSNTPRLADLNNDNQDELIMNGHLYQIISNNQLSDNVIINNQSSANFMRMADLDNDGDLDLFSRYNCCTWYQNGMGIYYNQGDMTFSNVKMFELNDTMDVIDEATDFGAFDYNNDGLLDIITSTGGIDDNLIAIENATSNSFGQSFETGIKKTTYNMTVDDFDGDGIDDLLFFSYFDIDIIYGKDGFALPPTNITPLTGWTKMITGDLNGDDFTDIIVSNSTADEIYYYENDGSGNFNAPLIVTDQIYNIADIAIGDINDDGKPDICYIDEKSSGDVIAWNQNNLPSGFNNTQYILDSTTILLYNINFVDYDLDGDDDMFCLRESDEIYFYEHDSASIFQSPTIFATIPEMNGTSHKLTFYDLDYDYDQEMIFAGNGVVKIFENLSNHNYRVIGKTFFDSNQNGILDTADQNLSGIQTTISPKAQYAFSRKDGSFEYYLGQGTYQITHNADTSWVLSTDSNSYTITTNDSIPFVDSLFFGFYPKDTITKINSAITGSFPRCNDTNLVWINVKNIGTTQPDLVVKLVLDSNIILENSNVTADSSFQNQYFWYINDLRYFTDSLLVLNTIMPDVSQIGNNLCSKLYVFDVNDSFNLVSQDSICQILVCSYDPNDKLVTPQGIDSMGYIADTTSKLTYTVRFQNTGNDTAFLVRITDELDPNLDWSSLKVLGASHSLTTTVNSFGLVTFTFADLELPYESIDELGSMGFVKFSILLNDSISPNTTIENTAKIYFDQNDPIITNTALSTLYECLPTINSNIEDTALCEGRMVDFIASDVLSTTEFFWNMGTLPSVVTDTLQLSNAPAGNYALTLYSANELCEQDTSYAVINIDTRSTDTLSIMEICQDDSILIFGEYKSVSGIYTDSLLKTSGCDSLIFQELVINPKRITNLSPIEICEGDTATIFGISRTISGVYSNNLSTVKGCDSTINQELIVNSQFNDTLSPISICIGDSIEIFEQVHYNSGLLIDSNTTVKGCDSINVQELIVNQDYEFTYTDSILEGENYTFDDGNTINNISNDTTYESYLESTNLCDSVVITHLRVFVDTTTTGLTNFGTAKIKIYPNPIKDIIKLETIESYNDVSVEIINLNSEVLYQKYFKKLYNEEIDVQKLPKGSYFLIITLNQNQEITKIIKN